MMRQGGRDCVQAIGGALLLCVTLLANVVAAQTTSGSLTGIVQDSSGAVIPGATVTLTSNRRGTAQTTVTNETGTFVFPQVEPDEYTLRVALEGFKTTERTRVVLNANDKLSVGVLTLETGAVSEVLQVAARVTEVQSASAERSYAVEGEVVQHVAVNSRSYLALVNIAPGVVSTADLKVAGHQGLGAISANGARPNTNNLTLDGIGNVDTGNNGDQLATLSLDAVAEFKILTANYQAEYGRSSGAQISVVTKSGGRDFHGSGYFFKRDDALNANSWMNNRDGLDKQIFRLTDVGYTVGGPIYLPNKFNADRSKLFFFVSQEYQHQFQPHGIERVKVPTALERQGDFSQSVDRDGRPYPYIKDWTTNRPCGPTDTSGCFQDGGVLGRIPADRLYQPGLAILGMYPLPNDSGQGYNYTSQISANYPRREDMYRVDWSPNEKWRVYGRFVHNKDSVTSPYGSFVLGANVPITDITDTRPGNALAINVTRVISSSMFNEVTVGFGKNQINIDPVNNGLTAAQLGLTGLPRLYPNAVQNDFVPQFAFGDRIGTSPNFGTNNAPFYNYNRTIDIVDNFTKVFSRHTVKMGLYFQRSYKDQTSFADANGHIEFNDSTANPFDTTYGYANAATGAFSLYRQASQYATGKYRYNNVEWYIQDNWKAGSRLTLDYGIRFYYIQPQYDSALQTATFLPQDWNAASAPRLYQPVMGPDGSAAGFDPVTGQMVAGTFIGRLVPGSGDTLNGVRQAGQGVNKYLMEDRGLHYAPRFGATYDLTGKQEFILRGGAGIFYDRFQGNETFDMLTNPPTTFVPVIQNGRLQTLDPNNFLLAPPGLHAFEYAGYVPTTANYNVGVQLKMPWHSILDVSYVGGKSWNQLARRNLNAIPYGATYLPENQDPTRTPSGIPGADALPRDFLRPYPGYGDITLHTMDAESNYNALQVSINRRFVDGLLLSVSYVWSKALGLANADGDYLRIDGLEEPNYGLLAYDRRHNFTVNFVYEIPHGSARFNNAGWAKALLDNWQISGIYRAVSGTPYTPDFNVAGISNQTLTGSYTEPARIVVTGDAGSGHSDDPYRQLNAAAFTTPQPGSRGLESGRNWLVGPGINNLDLSLSRYVPLYRNIQLELRADAFNVFNHTQFNEVNSTLNVNGLYNPVPTNLPYDASGNIVNKTGFGTVKSVRDPRILQLAARVTF